MRYNLKYSHTLAFSTSCLDVLHTLISKVKFRIHINNFVLRTKELLYQARTVVRLKQVGGYTSPYPGQSKTDRLGSLRCHKNIKKGVDLASKTITLPFHHTFWYISLPSLYVDYHVKLHISHL